MALHPSTEEYITRGARITLWRGRGVGTLLLEAIGGRARDAGITTFTAVVGLCRNSRKLRDITVRHDVGVPLGGRHQRHRER